MRFNLHPAWVIPAVLSAVASAAPRQPLVTADLLAASKPSDWRALDPENALYLELPSGRVVIELAPAFAPRHVANVKALARAKYWDGLAIVRVQDNYVVQWADPDAEDPKLKRPLKTGPGAPKETLSAEFERAIGADLPFIPLPDKDVYAPEVGFSNGFPAARDRKSGKTWLAHCYGAVGAGRDDGIDSGGGTELYAVIGHAPRHLDRNVTLLGRVVYGIELLSSLPRGHGAAGFYEKNEPKVPIRAATLAADVPPAERTDLELLRTDTPLFAQLIEARQNRREAWFHSQAGHVDICNVPLPVRLKTASADHP